MSGRVFHGSTVWRRDCEVLLRAAIQLGWDGLIVTQHRRRLMLVEQVNPLLVGCMLIFPLAPEENDSHDGNESDAAHHTAHDRADI